MSLVKSFFTVSGFTLISRITGFARDIMIAAMMGAGPLMEVFVIAFKLPNFFRRLFAEGAFNAAFVPMFSGTLTNEGQEEAENFAESVLAVLLMVLLGFSAVMMLAMPWVMLAMAPGFINKPEQMELATTLTRITFPYLTFISLVSLFSGILNSLGKFAIVAASPIMLNLMMMAMLYFATPYLPNPAYSLAIGLTITGVLQLLWVMAGCRRAKIHVRFRRPRMNANVRKFLKKMAPGILGAGVVQINLWVDIMIGTFIPSAIAYLYFADRVCQLPLSLIGTAMGTALLPLLSRQIREGRHEEAMVTQNRALEMVLFLTIPATTALILTAEPIISGLFERGAFTESNALASAYGLMAYATGLPAFVLVKMLSTAYFAEGDTKTPVKTAIISMIVNVILNIVFIFAFKAMGWLPHIGIALATSCASWLNVVQLAIGLKKHEKFIADSRLKARVVRIIISTALMAVVLVVLEAALQGWLHDGELKRAIALAALVGVGGAVFFAAAHQLKAFDVQEIKGFLRRRK